MAIPVTLPQMGESVVEGTVERWLVREGERVEKEGAQHDGSAGGRRSDLAYAMRVGNSSTGARRQATRPPRATSLAPSG